MFKQIVLLTLVFLLLLVACTPGEHLEISAETLTAVATGVSISAETGPVDPARPTAEGTALADEEPIPGTVIWELPVNPTPEFPDVNTPASNVTLSWQPNPAVGDEAFYQALNDRLSGPQANLSLIYEADTDSSVHAIKLKTEMAAGVGPDVFWLPADELAEFVNDGVLLDLRPYAAGFNTEQFYPGPLRHLTFDPASGEQGNRLWGLPSEVDTLAIYLNLDLIGGAAAADPRQLAAEGNWNWTTFLEVAQAINDPAGGIYGYEQPWFWWSFGVWPQAAGGGLIQADGSCGLTTAESLAGFSFAHQLYQEAQVTPPYGTANSLFLEGKVGMGLFKYDYGRYLEAAPFNWDVVELPVAVAGGAESGNWLFWGAYVVSAYSDHPQEAWQLVQALTSAEIQGQMAANGGALPSRPDMVEGVLAGPINNRAFWNGLQHGMVVAPNWSDGLTYDDFSCSAVTHLLSGGLSLADFSAEACNQFTQASITVCP